MKIFFLPFLNEERLRSNQFVLKNIKEALLTFQSLQMAFLPAIHLKNFMLL